jgi:UDP-N-acetylmuramoyl-L-alanyl-D-glutamate--2,6-diaminopimelate ligase
MKLRELAGSDFPEIEHLLASPIGETEINGLTADSREVQPGMLFVAVAGNKADGAKFAADAKKRGASVIVANASSQLDVDHLPVEDSRLFLSLAAARFYGKQPEVMVAVTGTAGKTSVASFLRQIWAFTGKAAAQIGTTGVIAPGRDDYGSLTTPDPIALQKLLAELAGEGVSHGVMEASSHGLDQNRLDGVTLLAGGFTNLGRDHMDYHPTIEDYLDAKMRLFNALVPEGAPAVVFSDDAFSQQVCDTVRASGRDLKTVGRKGDFLTLKRVEHFRHKQMAEIHHDGIIYEVDIPLAGEFQIANALVAAGLAIATGSEPFKVFKALETLKGASGRLELVGQTADGALAYVDYAHKPDALENVLTSVRPFTSGRIITVFGCGGDRDKGKRPLMGEIAIRLSDVVIVTDDNPRSEVPETIRAEIMAAAPGAIEIGDRATAIFEAVAMLQCGDTLIVAGKGHEEGQIVGSVTLPFSDHQQLRIALEGKSH